MDGVNHRKMPPLFSRDFQRIIILIYSQTVFQVEYGLWNQTFEFFPAS